MYNQIMKSLDEIRQIIRDEHAECDVKSPMSKLETFFINIVAQAREQAVPTSGAESKTEISGFLTAAGAEKLRPAAMLDELVSPAASAPQPSQETPQTHEVHPVRSSPEEDLLRKLTAQPEPKPVAADSSVQPTPAEQQLQSEQQIRKDILDRLTGRADSDRKNQTGGD